MAKVLAVEDEALVRLLIVEALENAGYAVLEAPDGEAALSIVRETPDLDVIVTDIRMPKLDGFALAQSVRQIRPDVALLFMTGYSGADMPPDLKSVKTLQKPFDPDDLVAAVENILAANA